MFGVDGVPKCDECGKGGALGYELVTAHYRAWHFYCAAHAPRTREA